MPPFNTTYGGGYTLPQHAYIPPQNLHDIGDGHVGGPGSNGTYIGPGGGAVPSLALSPHNNIGQTVSLIGFEYLPTYR